MSLSSTSDLHIRHTPRHSNTFIGVHAHNVTGSSLKDLVSHLSLMPGVVS